MITLGALIGMVMLIVVPAFIPLQNGNASMRFDEIVSAQRRGVEDRLGELSPKWVSPINMKDDIDLLQITNTGENK